MIYCSVALYHQQTVYEHVEKNEALHRFGVLAACGERGHSVYPSWRVASI